GRVAFCCAMCLCRSPTLFPYTTLFRSAAPEDPGEAERRQAALQIDGGLGVGVGTARVVEADRRIAPGERDRAHRDADVGTRAGEVHLARHARPPFAGINQVRFMRSAAVSRPLSPVRRAPAVSSRSTCQGYARTGARASRAGSAPRPVHDRRRAGRRYVPETAPETRPLTR